MMFMDVDTALSEVPVNLIPLTSDSDFKTVDEGILYDESGMDLYWHFTTTGGASSRDFPRGSARLRPTCWVSASRTSRWLTATRSFNRPTRSKSCCPS